jgi:hypothetical protein
VGAGEVDGGLPGAAVELAVGTGVAIGAGALDGGAPDALAPGTA